MRIRADFVIGYFGINLCRVDTCVAQHLTDRFQRNALRKRDFGGVGMPLSLIHIFGSANLRRKMIDYLKRIHGPIVNGDLSIARPNFPGLESTFGISINFDNIIQLDIKQKDIDEYLKYTDSHQRVHNLVNLYVQPLIRYTCLLYTSRQ